LLSHNCRDLDMRVRKRVRGRAARALMSPLRTPPRSR
jgi:hypothetical protein